MALNGVRQPNGVRRPSSDERGGAAMNRVQVRIDRLRLPAGTPLDREDLQRRVALELAELLRRVPPPERRGDGDARLRLRAGRVTVAAPGSGAAVAHALARRIHAQLRFGEAGG